MLYRYVFSFVGDGMNVTHFRNGEKLQTLIQVSNYDYNAPGGVL